jgi:HEAT repeat protein
MPILRQLLWSLVLAAFGGVARGEIRAELETARDPEIRVPAPVQVYTKRLKPLWLEALARPEAEMQRLAADAFGRGHAAGIPDLEDAIPALVTILTSSSSHPAARLAAAQALVKFEAKEARPKMAEAAQRYGADVRQVIEPALASWNYQPQREVWLARLTRTDVRYRDLTLAIDCLATTREKSSVSALLDIVNNRFRPPAIRTQAARAAGRLQNDGLESAARKLIAGSESAPLVNRLCAAWLIAGHSGDDAQKVLLQLAADSEPAVANVALKRLIEVDPHLVLPLAERGIENADPEVRQRGAEALSLVPDSRRIALIARLLDDPDPSVRGSVRESLYNLSRRTELDDSIRRAASEMLAGDRWRGLEQAALLLAALDHKPAAPRLIELLDFNRLEVGIAAAWGLKTLAVAQTLPAMLDKARRQDKIRRAAQTEPPGLDAQTAHLFEAFGRLKYQAAEPLLLEYVPKNLRIGVESRKSAIWALGLLHEGVPDEPLADKLMDRLLDPVEGQGAEWSAVKEMSAVSIARMKAVSQVTPLRKFVGSMIRPDRQGMAIRWALMELTGESIPEPAAPTLADSAIWFLESLDDQ